MIEKLLEGLNDRGVQLVAVSKTKTVERISVLYDLGIRVFGENRVQELLEKQKVMPNDIQWHIIGHLQTNKVKFIAPFISLIHSVDSLKLLKEIDKQAKKNERRIDVLLQMYVATEETKFGLSQDELREVLDVYSSGSLNNIRIVGLMGMASFSSDENLVRSEFKKLKNIYDDIKQHHIMDEAFNNLSMGMSSDYKLAIEEGSNMVRIGSLLFQ